ncbi:glycosyltransferase family 29 protein [Pseudovibrio ascidiaceicola]|uniref:glycosyltransferase family 29 protein n=1 Tax=Pseudovibrio ascidiaceicola TaxID=285279 RepID=UPI003D35FEEC
MQLKRYFAQKSVAVVGNSMNLLNYQYGSEIDAHDVVIRMNRGVIIPQKNCFGHNTNVWCYSTFKLVKDIYRKSNCDYRVCMSPKNRVLTNRCSTDLFFPIALWKRLNNELEARPSVGAMVTYLLAQCDPASVDIYGFDFKASKSFYEKSNNTGSHNFQREQELLQQIIITKGWSLKDCSLEYNIEANEWKLSAFIKKYFST